MSAAVCAVAIGLTCNGMQLSVPSANQYNTQDLQIQATQTEKNLAFHILNRVWTAHGNVTLPASPTVVTICQQLNVSMNCEGTVARYNDDSWPLDSYELQMVTAIWGPLFLPGTPPQSRVPVTVMPQYSRQQHDP